eukprot:scaffold25913_cov23-Cyclotella_meneghiniana.AAC.6
MSTTIKQTEDDRSYDQSSQAGVKVQNPPSSLLVMSLLACDPKEIASQARHDDDLLSKLNAFSRSLNKELYKVSEERREEIELATKRKEQSDLAKKVGCLDCKTKDGNFKCCAKFGRRRCCEDSSVFCETCFEKKKDSMTFCWGCQSLLCNKCLEDKFGKCCYTENEFKCHSIFCSDCAFKEDYFQCEGSVYVGRRMEECNKWFCADHKKKSKKRRTCYECHEVEDVCD